MTFSYNYEFPIGRELNGKWVEYLITATFDIEPFVRGVTSGPVEKCYPDEGGTAELCGIDSVKLNGEIISVKSFSLTPEEIENAECDAYKAAEEDHYDRSFDYDEDYQERL